MDINKCQRRSSNPGPGNILNSEKNMPNHLKFIISGLALGVTLALFFYDTYAGFQGAARWVALFLGPFVIFAIWVFPEPQTKAVRKEGGAAARPRLPCTTS